MNNEKNSNNNRAEGIVDKMAIDEGFNHRFNKTCRFSRIFIYLTIISGIILIISGLWSLGNLVDHLEPNDKIIAGVASYVAIVSLVLFFVFSILSLAMGIYKSKLRKESIYKAMAKTDIYSYRQYLNKQLQKKSISPGALIAIVLFVIIVGFIIVWIWPTIF